MASSKTLADLVRGGRRTHSAVDERPGCAFGLVTRKGLEDLNRDFERIELKINGLLFGIALTIVLQVWRAMG